MQPENTVMMEEGQAEDLGMDGIFEMDSGPAGYPITADTRIERRPDGSYVLDGIYHAPAGVEEFAEKFAEIEAIAAANPERIIILPAPTEDELEAESLASLWANLRAERDLRIAATDYLAMADYPISEEGRAEVLAYRQALRDMPDMEGAPFDGGGKGRHCQGNLNNLPVSGSIIREYGRKVIWK